MSPPRTQLQHAGHAMTMDGPLSPRIKLLSQRTEDYVKTTVNKNVNWDLFELGEKRKLSDLSAVYDKNEYEKIKVARHRQLAL